MTFSDAKYYYRSLLKSVPNLDEEIYIKVLNVNEIIINKKIRSPFRIDKSPSFQFRYCNMDDYFASTENNTVTRTILCSVDYTGWKFKAGTYTIPVSLVAYIYNLYTKTGSIDFPRVVSLIYDKLGKELPELSDNYQELQFNSLVQTQEKIEQPVSSIVILDCDYVTPDNFSKSDLDYWANQCNADIEILKAFDIKKTRKAYIYKENDDVIVTHSDGIDSNTLDSDPCYVYTSQNNRLKLYRPKASNMLKWRSTHTNDDVCGLSLISCFEKNVSNRNRKLVIQKALKECMLFYSLYPNIAVDCLPVNSESTFFNDELWNKLVEFYGRDNIIYIGDNDSPGISAAKKISRKYNIKVNWMEDKTYKNTTDYWSATLASQNPIISRIKMSNIINNLINSSRQYKSTKANNVNNNINNSSNLIDYLKQMKENNQNIFNI